MTGTLLVRPGCVTAFEHQIIPVCDGRPNEALSLAEAEQLARLGEQRPGFYQRGHLSVRLAQYCGIVRIGSRILEILPKVDESLPDEACRDVMLRLLRQSGQFPLFKAPSVGHHLRRAPLLDVFISAFFDSIADVLRGGLMRRYQEHEEDLRFLRGRIIAGRQFAAHSNRVDLVACRFDDLTANNIWNQLIKAALWVVRPWISSVESQRRWVEFIAVFDEVEDVDVHSEHLDRLVFDRQAVRYKPTIEWVRCIVGLLSPAVRSGRKDAPGLLFDMNKLFESAVASVLRRRAGAGVEVLAQQQGHYLGELQGVDCRKAFDLRPDLILRRGQDIVAIGDTKWKMVELKPHGYLVPTSEDAYQMQSYATAIGCRNLALIYPWHSGLSASKETTYELKSMGHGSSILTIVCVDVSKDSLELVLGGDAFGFGTILRGGIPE